jgi:predicted Rossmann fold nucleotide-binding protein DprA/Smf involved in DNA uptake
MKKVSVIGSGTMGNGIAHVFAQNGFATTLIDINPLALEKAMATIKKNLDRMLSKGTISEAQLNQTLQSISTSSDLKSAVSDADLVVEAATRSGSLITAKQALDMGKEVFAIPGSIHTTVAKGCHDLIKQGAKLVDCAQDILEELKDLPILVEKSAATEISESASDSAVEAALLGADDQTRKVLDHLGHDPVGLDELQMRSGLPTAQLQAELFQLELNGALGRLPGGLYQKLKRASTRYPRAF